MSVDKKDERFQSLIKTEKKLNTIQDVDVMLENLLKEARAIVHADAGSIYVYDSVHNVLKIKYSQNDSKQRELPPGEKLPYNFYSFPVNESSICGCSLLHREIINIEDAYKIPSDKVYKFNRLPDEDMNYHTVSMLTIPLVIPGNKERVLGVLQIINAQDEKGNVISFTDDDVLFMNHFAESATRALERAFLTETMVLRMVRMAEMRDPRETGPHVTRVALISKEIYDQWAFNHDIPHDERERYRDLLSVAAKLHDVGKVGISDELLKLPRRFTTEERNRIKQHTYICEFLFDSISSDLDKMAKEIAIRHHEHWDGNGYPGKYDIQSVKNLQTVIDVSKNEKVSGEAIPLSARIVAIADVFDALYSKRYYKEPWPSEDVLEEIRGQSGHQFDPEIVEAFFEALPRIKEIHQSYPDIEYSYPDGED